ncbi:MAG: cation:proton antiporter [Dermatophilaceae bacterium]
MTGLTLAVTSPRRRTVGVVLAQLMLLALALLLVRLLISAGNTSAEPVPGATGASPGAPGGIAGQVLLACLAVIVVTRAAGWCAGRVGQPRVVGEIVGGVLLGPTVLGALAPTVAGWLLPPAVMPVLDGLADLGLVLFMFLVGLELDTRLVRRQGHQAATLANIGLVVPFTLGVAVALLLYPTFGAGRAFTPFALFLGVAMAVSALPVLAAILTERGLAGTRLGTLALSCAVAEDVAAWCLLAVVVAFAQATNPGTALGTIAMSAGYAVLMLGVVRPLLRRVVARWLPDGRVTPAALAAVVAGLLLSAAATSLIGIHAIFGAFLFGVVLPAPTPARQALARRIGDLTGVLLLPMFFAVSGLHTDLRVLGGAAAWAALGLVMLAAVGGKLGAVTVAGRGTGLPWREATCLGVLLNTRGLTELVILGIGLQLGAIPEPVYALLVLMAVVTTMIANPLLTRILPRPHEGAPS